MTLGVHLSTLNCGLSSGRIEGIHVDSYLESKALDLGIVVSV